MVKITIALACLVSFSALAQAGGPSEGGAAAGTFGYPDGVALARDGSLYVVDTDNAALKKISPAGEITTVLGTGLQYPTGVALAPDGTLYVADAGSRAVWQLAPAAASPRKLTGRGFTYPSAVAVAPDGTLYVADVGPAASGSVQKISPGGRAEVLAIRLAKPTSLAVAADGTLYVAEGATGSIWKISPTGLAAPWLRSTLLDQPHGLAVGTGGELYVADTYHHRVLLIGAGGQVATLAAGFSYPSGLAVDAAGTVYVADTGHGALRRISAAGAVSAVPGQAEGKASAAPLK